SCSFNSPSPTRIYTLSLHDALPIWLYEAGTPFTFRNIAGDEHPENEAAFLAHWPVGKFPLLVDEGVPIMESSVIVEHAAPAMVPDRKSTRLNSSHDQISYAVFCLKK